MDLLSPDQKSMVDEMANLNADLSAKTMECIRLKNVLKRAENLLAEAEEYSFDDGLGKGALHQYWDDLQKSIDVVNGA